MRNSILPALIPKTWDDLVAFADLMVGEVAWVQVDVTDGVYVANTSWPYTEGGTKSFDQLVAGSLILPRRNPHKFRYEFDLMIEKTPSEVLKFVQAGASAVVIHESSSVFDILAALQPARLPEFPLRVGIALPFNAKPVEFEPYKELVDFVQIMGINQVGFQGQPYEPVVAHTVAEFHAAYPGLLLQVDGGIGHEQLHTLIESGANMLVVGSAILNAPDQIGALHELQHELARING